MIKEFHQRRKCFLYLVTTAILGMVFLSECMVGSSVRNSAGKLTIVFMNDTHSYLYPWRDEKTGREYGGAARWASIIENIRKETGKVLFLHGGDIFSGSDIDYMIPQRLPEWIPDWDRLPGYGYRGMLDVPVFGMLGLDAAVFGNHEFDDGFSWLYRRYHDAPFAVLAANVNHHPAPEIDPPIPSFWQPYRIFDVAGTKAAVIGLGTDEYIQTSQIRVTDPAEAVEPLIAELKKKCDVVVILSHLGHKKDRELAEKIPGINVIVGGHSHTLLSEPVVINGTIITQTRAYGEFVGRLDLSYKDGTVTDFRHTLIPADLSVPEDPEVRAYLEKRRFPLQLEKPLDSSNTEQSSLGAWITEAIGNAYSCDAVLIKNEYYRGTLPAGPVSAQEFFALFWPYRRRARGPEKDLFPQQLIAITQGKAPARTRFFLESAFGDTTLIRMELPFAVMEDIRTLNQTWAGSGDFLQIGYFNREGSTLDVVMDLPSWLDLYDRGILRESDTYQILDREVFEVLLPSR
jgi:2',3'-cyclic-nucleotide 2'-phosphodiesterase (5'-nucleotidase family)